VQANSRVTIPATEVEKLDLEQGDLVQIVLTPIEELPDGVADDSEEDQ
jgi:antitoxin component of MazEF toxin-antitoxin module